MFNTKYSTKINVIQLKNNKHLKLTYCHDNSHVNKSKILMYFATCFCSRELHLFLLSLYYVFVYMYVIKYNRPIKSVNKIFSICTSLAL